MPVKNFPIAPMPTTSAPAVSPVAQQVAPAASISAVPSYAVLEAATRDPSVKRLVKTEKLEKLPAQQQKHGQLDEEQLRIKDNVQSILGRFDHKKKVELLGRLADEVLKEENNFRDPRRYFSESQ